MQNNAGSRVWPNSRDDPAVCIRFDWAEAHKKDEKSGKYFRWLNCQLNKNASNSTIAGMATGKGSHAKRASICVETDANGQVVATEEQLASQLKTHFVDEASSKGL